MRKNENGGKVENRLLTTTTEKLSKRKKATSKRANRLTTRNGKEFYEKTKNESNGKVIVQRN